MIEFWRKITKADIRNTLTMVWVVLSFIFLFKLLNKPIPAENKDVVNTVAGVIIGQVVVILGYYFTQSKTEVDEKRKDENS